MDWQARMDEARARYMQAAAEEAAAWGPRGTDGIHALPRAVQIAARLEVALAADQNDPKAQDAVKTLRRALAQFQRDPEDQERCRVWRAAYARYEAALAEVETIAMYMRQEAICAA
jgi:hypothetical protein